MDKRFSELIDFFGPYFDAPEDKTRERIVLAAKKRFMYEGFARVTIGDMCHDMRISKKTFYKHFKDKEDIVLAVIAHNMKIFIPKMAESFTNDAHPEQQLEFFLDFLINEFPKHVTVAFMADVQALLPDVWEVIDTFRKKRIQNFFEILKRGQQKGVFTKAFDADKASRLFLILIDRFLDPKLLYENELQLSDVMSIWLVLLRDGIYSKEYKESRQ